MTSFTTRYPSRLWLALSDIQLASTEIVLAAHDPVTCWEDAVDLYAEQRGKGEDCWIFALDLSTGTICDHTAEAHEHLRARLKNRAQELPEWMEEAA